MISLEMLSSHHGFILRNNGQIENIFINKESPLYERIRDIYWELDRIRTQHSGPPDYAIATYDAAKEQP
jgi:hypothetical protein